MLGTSTVGRVRRGLRSRTSELGTEEDEAKSSGELCFSSACSKVTANPSPGNAFDGLGRVLLHRSSRYPEYAWSI